MLNVGDVNFISISILFTEDNYSVGIARILSSFEITLKINYSLFSCFLLAAIKETVDEFSPDGSGTHLPLKVLLTVKRENTMNRQPRRNCRQPGLIYRFWSSLILIHFYFLWLDLLLIDYFHGVIKIIKPPIRQTLRHLKYFIIVTSFPQFTATHIIWQFVEP